MNQFGKNEPVWKILNWFNNKIEPIQKLNHNICNRVGISQVEVNIKGTKIGHLVIRKGL